MVIVNNIILKKQPESYNIKLFQLITKYYEDDQVKEDEMGGAYSWKS
jgi:hypothetical protein